MSQIPLFCAIGEKSMRLLRAALFCASLLQGMELPITSQKQADPDFLTAKKLSCMKSPHLLLAAMPRNYGFWAEENGSVRVAEITKMGAPLSTGRILTADEGYCLESLVCPTEWSGYLWKKKGKKYQLVSIYPSIYDAGFCTKILKADKPYPLACFDQDILLIRRDSDIVEADIEARILLKKQQVVYRKPEGKKFPDYEGLQEASHMPIAVTNAGIVVCMDECGEIEILRRDTKTHQLISLKRLIAFHNMPNGKFAVHKDGYAFAYNTKTICIARLHKKLAFEEVFSLAKKYDAISGAFHPTKFLAVCAVASKLKQKTEIIFFSPKKVPVVQTIDQYVTDLQWPTESDMLFGISDGKSVLIAPLSYE